MRSGGEIAYVALGGNLGDRDANLAAAAAQLEATRDVLLLTASAVYETPPLGPPGQPAYLNAVLALRVWISPDALLGRLQAIEDALGRDRGESAVRWGPRTIDLDLLFYGSRCIERPALVVPHPRLHERDFVLAPLSDVAPELRHPKLGVTIAELVFALEKEAREEEGIRRWPRPVGWPGGELTVRG